MLLYALRIVVTAGLALAITMPISAADFPASLVVEGALAPQNEDTGGGSDHFRDVLFRIRNDDGSQEFFVQVHCGVWFVGRDARFGEVLTGVDLDFDQEYWLGMVECDPAACAPAVPDPSQCAGPEIWSTKLDAHAFAHKARLAGFAEDADKLDGLDSTDFVQHTDTAGGDLSGPFTNLQIVPGAVGTPEIADGSVTEPKLAFDPATQAELDVEKARIDTLEAKVAALEDLLQHFSRSGNEVTITGANLNIVNGTGNTTTGNGLGNLVVGYNALRTSGNDRSGSHVIVTGDQNNYPGSGGLVVGFINDLNGNRAAISGGRRNVASGNFSSVGGGFENRADGLDSSVGGGRRNIASGNSSSVTGGLLNRATSTYASVTGGRANQATSTASSVAGGISNRAGDLYASVAGGQANRALERAATVSGGRNNLASGNFSSISGGFQNAASGTDSSVSGGRRGLASGASSSVNGGFDNDATATYASVSGGRLNVASALYSAVGGGFRNTVRPAGQYAVVSGGRNSDASGRYSSVSGGFQNLASGLDSSVSGGRRNESRGASSVIGGGFLRSVFGTYDWRAGTLFENQ